MDVIELLRQVGLSQYEAEAYTTLLREGPLTGYELGKRSKVALPRIYDVLERLQRRGLVLVQPGDPPHYRAEEPAIYLRQLRTSMTARLEELEAQLRTLSPGRAGEEFWVVRGRDQIRDRAAAMIESAEHSVGLRLPPDLQRELAGAIAGARRRCRVQAIDGGSDSSGDAVLVVVDDLELLAGTTDDPAQAVVTRNRALVALAGAEPASGLRSRAASPETAETGTDWLAWEADKQRRLRLLTGGSDVA
jgi:sugar-specific transcriptional regulator TrmB